jgi:hypothetical protein
MVTEVLVNGLRVIMEIKCYLGNLSYLDACMRGVVQGNNAELSQETYDYFGKISDSRSCLHAPY